MSIQILSTDVARPKSRSFVYEAVVRSVRSDNSHQVPLKKRVIGGEAVPWIEDGWITECSWFWKSNSPWAKAVKPKCLGNAEVGVQDCHSFISNKSRCSRSNWLKFFIWRYDGISLTVQDSQKDKTNRSDGVNTYSEEFPFLGEWFGKWIREREVRQPFWHLLRWRGVGLRSAKGIILSVLICKTRWKSYLGDWLVSGINSKWWTCVQGYFNTRYPASRFLRSRYFT